MQIKLVQLKPIIETIFQQYENIILVGHGLDNDLKVLEKLDIGKYLFLFKLFNLLTTYYIFVRIT